MPGVRERRPGLGRKRQRPMAGDLVEDSVSRWRRPLVHSAGAAPSAKRSDSAPVHRTIQNCCIKVFWVFAPKRQRDRAEATAGVRILGALSDCAIVGDAVLYQHL